MVFADCCKPASLMSMQMQGRHRLAAAQRKHWRHPKSRQNLVINFHQTCRLARQIVQSLPPPKRWLDHSNAHFFVRQHRVVVNDGATIVAARNIGGCHPPPHHRHRLKRRWCLSLEFWHVLAGADYRRVQRAIQFRNIVGVTGAWSRCK